MTAIKLKRGLNFDERTLAESVFFNTLPWDKIIISNTIGAGKRQYVTPELRHDGGWIMHLGGEMYAGGTTGWYSDVFIHELTHVWQSYHSPKRWNFVANSMCHQILMFKGAKAYDYTTGAAWQAYNVEQQAQIVSHWYNDGMVESDSRFQYIRDNIRKGVN